MRAVCPSRAGFMCPISTTSGKMKGRMLRASAIRSSRVSPRCATPAMPRIKPAISSSCAMA
ncbi:hypothetical protein [Polaromonas sp. UC242_47]|uniref:hypothetical protein n=1 Tax=Polaromonas sp. UC242_47 TaxID=3374626 RepID=UPI0037A92E34